MNWRLGPLAALVVFAGACERPASDNSAYGDREPDPSSGEPVWFEERGVSAGVDFVHESGHDGKRFYFPEIMGGGAAIFDYDGDGRQDLYLVNSGTFHPTDEAPARNRLYRNRGDGTFEDVTDSATDADDAGYGMGVTTGDYDGDGDVDLYVANVGANALLRNNGDGTFTDTAMAAGVADDGWGTSCAFLDYDRDGDLDLYVCNYVIWSLERDLVCFGRTGAADYCSPQSYGAPQPDVLYENLGDGTFADVSRDAGLRAAFGTGLGVVWGDLDGDGLPDVFVANDGLENQCWINQGDGGGFVDKALALGCAVDRNGKAKAGMGVLAADVDDDLDLDLLVVNLESQSDSLFRNEGGAYFTDEAPGFGLGVVSRSYTRFGVGWFDFDLDGVLDLYEANGRVTLPDQVEAVEGDPFAEVNLLLRGDGAGRFVPVAPAGGTRTPLSGTSRGAAFGDLDDDGRLDVVVVNRDARAHVLFNVVDTDGHWIRFDVRDENGAPALGASVRLTAGARTLRRDVQVASSYCSANDPRVHVGLGAVDAVSNVTIHWPDGTVQALPGPFAVDQQHEIRRQASSGNGS